MLKKGRIFEEKAALFLQKQGLQILQRNFNTRGGEVDLIAKHNNVIVFIEVRYRQNQQYGGPLESITYQKRKKISKTAQIYLQKNSWTNCLDCRFDIIAITGSMHALQIEWIQDAFCVI